MPVNIFKLSGSVEVDTGRAEANLKKVDRAAKQTQTALTQADSAGKKAGSGIASGFERSSSSASGLLGKINQIHSKLGSLKAPSLNFGGGSGGGGGFNVSSLVKGNLITGALSAATAGLTDALKDGWSAGIEYNKMLEKANISFTTLLGTTGKAQEHLKALQAFGEATPFEFPDLIKASQRMQAMGFAAQDIIPTLRNVGDAVSAVGGGKEELDGVVLALGQMQTKGKVSAEEMNQLAERGIPAWDLLAKAIGKTKEETIKLSEQGRISGGRAVQGITAMMGERFGGQMDKMSGTLAGRESNFNDILQRQLGGATAGNFDQLKAAYEKATVGLGTAGADTFKKELNAQLTSIGTIFEQDLQKMASGETFTKGAKAVAAGGALASKVGALADRTGVTKNAIGAGQSANELLFGDISNIQDPVDKAVFGGIKSALQAIGVLGKEEGVKAGDAIGQGIQDGTKANLKIESPSKVFIAIGANVVRGLNNGINESINRSSDGIKKWAKQIEQAGGEEFLKAVEAMAKRLKIDPNKIMNVMAFESGLDPAKKNPNSSASGLIQFMNSTATGMGTTTEKLRGMSAIEQLKFVEKYWEQFSKMADTQEAVYTSVLAGKAVSDPSSVLFTKGGKSTGRAYTANAALDADKSGTITAAEATAKVLKQGFLSAGDGAAQTASMLDQLSAALTGVRAKLSALTDSALAYVGYGAPTTATAAMPSAVIPKAIQQPAQTVQMGQLASAEVKAKTELLTLSKEAAAATVQMQVPLKELPGVSAKATEALKTTGSQAGQFADAIMDAGKATKEAIDHLSHFKDSFAGGFDQMFDDILDGQKISFKSFGKQLLKGGMSSVFSSLSNGSASSPGQFLSQALFGGLGGKSGGAGGGFGGGIPATGGFAGGGGANDILGKAQGVGSLFQKGGMLSKLPGLGKVGGLLGKIPGMAKLGSLFGFGGGGAAAGAAGGAGGAAGATGMAAMFSNPVTAIIAGGLMAAPFIAKLFGKDPLADYRKHIKSEYGVDIKSKAILGKVMQAGQSAFGAEWQKRQIETVRLPQVRDMIAEYSQGFMKGGNANLFSGAEYGDAFSAVNQFKVGMRANGGPVMAGMPYIVGERRAELFVPSQNGRIEPSVSGGGGGWFGKAKRELSSERLEEVLSMLSEQIGRLKPVQPGAVLEMGMAERPGAVAKDVRRSFDVRDEHSVAIRQAVGTY